MCEGTQAGSAGGRARRFPSRKDAGIAHRRVEKVKAARGRLSSPSEAFEGPSELR